MKKRVRLHCSEASLRMGPGLPIRQALVMSRVVVGDPIKVIAATLGFHQSYVSELKGRALNRVGCDTLQEFVAVGLRDGWITAEWLSNY